MLQENDSNSTSTAESSAEEPTPTTFFLVIFASQTQSTSELPLTEGCLQLLNEVLSTDAESTTVAVSVQVFRQ